VLENASLVDGVPVVSSEDRVVAELLLSLLWGGFVKERYWSEVKAGVDEGAFESRLRDAFGSRASTGLIQAIMLDDPEGVERLHRRLRRRLACRSMRTRPLGTALALQRFFVREVVLRVHPPGFTVVLLGPDGSGKSTVASELAVGAQGLFNSVSRLHLRPCILRGIVKGVVEAVSDPHGSPPRGVLASWAKIAFFLIDYWLGYILRRASTLAKGSLVLWDRHLLDMVVDPARARYGGGAGAVRLASMLIPQPDAVVVLDVPQEVVFGRKREVSPMEFDRQRAAYAQLARSHPRGVLVDGTPPPDVIATDVIGTIVRAMSQSRRWSGV